MNNATMMMHYETNKKSGGIAGFLNFLIPGAGYLYCRRWILAPIALFFALGAVGSGNPLIIAFFWGLFVVDGFLCAGRHNRKLVERMNLAAGSTVTGG